MLVRRPAFVRYKHKNGIWYLWVPAKLFVPFPPKLFHFSNDWSSFSMWFIRQSLFLLCASYTVQIIFFIHSFTVCLVLWNFRWKIFTHILAPSTLPILLLTHAPIFIFFLHSTPFAHSTVYIIGRPKSYDSVRNSHSTLEHKIYRGSKRVESRAWFRAQIFSYKTYAIRQSSYHHSMPRNLGFSVVK